jgi:DNA-binding XRE family transcriptional regulator
VEIYAFDRGLLGQECPNGAPTTTNEKFLMMKSIKPRRLRYIRACNRITLDEMAYHIGIDRGTLSRLERGISQRSKNVADVLVAFFDELIERLMSEVTEREFWQMECEPESLSVFDH